MWTNDSIELDTPANAAYSQWNEHQPFPCLVDGLGVLDSKEERNRLQALELHGVERVVDTVIVENAPGQRIVWLSTHGPERVGIVTFDSLTQNRSRVTLHLNFDGETGWGSGQTAAFVKATINGCLRRFVDRVEGHGQSSGTERC